MTEYSQEIIDYIQRFFQEDDWKYNFNEEHGTFDGGLDVDGKLGSVRFFLIVKDEYVLNVTAIKLNVDEEKRVEVAEYLTRVNYGLARGGFEMDFRDGEVRYRLTVSLADLRADCVEAMKRLLLLPGAMFERYGDGLLTVMFGFATPKEAAEKADAE